MNKYIRTLAASLAATIAAHAAPFLALGDSAELFLTGTVGIRADDNIFLTSNETSDTIFDIKPGFEFVFGQGSLTKGSFKFVENISRYSDNSGLNTELSSFAFNTKYDDGKSEFATSASYDQLNQNAPGLTGLTRRNVTALGLDAEISATQKSSVGVGLSYKDTEYRRAGYNDKRTVTVPVDYYWAVSAKVDLSVGYRYRDSEVQNALDSKDHFFRIGFRGDFSPNVTGTVKVGVGQRKFSGAGSEDILDLDAVLDFKVSAKSTFRLTASNDFDVSGQGQQQKVFSLGGSLISQVSDVLSLQAGFNFGKYDYYTREDDYTEVTLGVNYAVNKHIRITAAYSYRNNDSGLANGDFRNNVFSLAANLRY
jgi:hypothetical protein